MKKQVLSSDIGSIVSTRRQFLIGAGVAALTYTFKLQKAYPADYYVSGKYYAFQKNYKFENAHGNLKYRVERYYGLQENANRKFDGDFTPGLEALQSTLKDCEAKGRQIRAHGGKWSMSDVLKVGERGKGLQHRHKGFLVDTRGLNFQRMKFSDNFFDTVYFNQHDRGMRDRICFIQTGAMVRDVNQFLEANGSALPTSGASDGQTFVGAIMTGTHGAAVTRGAMQDYVKALHIMIDSQTSFLVQKASDPVLSKDAAEYLGAKELINNDELFLAAVVSFGSFGFVHGVFIQADPLYKLKMTLERHDFSDTKEALGSLDVTKMGYDADPYHIEMILNPYGVNVGQKGAFVQIMHKVSGDTPSSEPRAVAMSGASRDVMELAGFLTTVAPFAIAGQIDKLVNNDLYASRGNHVIWTPGMTFTGLPVTGGTIGTEIGVPMTHAIRAIEIAAQLAQDYPFAGVIANRFVKSSDAYMAFTKHAPVTCTIEVGALNNIRARKYFRLYWQALQDAGIPFTWHWGQTGNYDAANVREKFGLERVNKWIGARRNFLSAEGRRRFGNELLDRCEMN